MPLECSFSVCSASSLLGGCHSGFVPFDHPPQSTRPIHQEGSLNPWSLSSSSFRKKSGDCGSKMLSAPAQTRKKNEVFAECKRNDRRMLREKKIWKGFDTGMVDYGWLIAHLVQQALPQSNLLSSLLRDPFPARMRATVKP